MGYMRIGRVYEPIYTVNNLYNDLIILKIFSSLICFLYVF